MESERLRVNSKRSMTTSVDTDSDCGSESILLATDNNTNVKSKPIPAKRQRPEDGVDQPSTRLSIRNLGKRNSIL